MGRIASLSSGRALATGLRGSVLTNPLPRKQLNKLEKFALGLVG